jgi:hypothetical protein
MNVFQRIRDYDLIDAGGRVYRPRAYADPRSDGTWDGYLVFFPLGGGLAIATERETMQSTLDALTVWAAGITPVYLEGALARALQLASQPSVIDRLEVAEYEALEDADRLETAAEIERTTAIVDEMAAADARADAEHLRRERLVTESAIATTEALAATEAAERHEAAARDARAVAADATRRSRRADAATTTSHPKKPRSAKKK